MRDPKLYLEDILEAIIKIERYVEGMDMEQFREDDKTFDAVIMNFSIIGEVVKGIPSCIKDKYPEMPWKAMAGMRDKLIHDYFGIRFDIIWDTIKSRLPEVKFTIEKILNQIDT